MVKIGSRVKFISDTGVGIVRNIKGDMVYVEVDGFEIPALISDVVEVDIAQENEAIVRIGPDSPKVRSVAGTNPNSASNGKVKLRPTGQTYGRVAIVDQWEDDDEITESSYNSGGEADIDMVKMRQNYHKNRVAQVVADNQKAQAEAAVQKAPFEITDFEMKLAFVPTTAADKEPQESDLEAFIVNDSSYKVYYNIAQWRSGYVETISCGLIEADTKLMIKKFGRASLAQVINLHISILPFKATSYVPQTVEGFDIELHPLKFVRGGSYIENDFFDQRAVVFTLASASLGSPGSFPSPISSHGDAAASGVAAENAALAATGGTGIRPKNVDAVRMPVAASSSRADTQVVDLHAEEFLDNFNAMGNGEILQAQISRFTIALDGAIKSKQKGKIVFIHGVGKGKLKHEMKKVLDRTYSKLRYQDASFEEYGYGAIMVFL